MQRKVQGDIVKVHMRPHLIENEKNKKNYHQINE